MTPQIAGMSSKLNRGMALRFAGNAQLPHYHVQQNGAPERLIDAQGTVILDFAARAARKAEAGAAIRR